MLCLHTECDVFKLDVASPVTIVFNRKTDRKADRKTLRIAFHHLESIPKMKYNNQIITKRYLNVFEKKNYKQPYVKTTMDRRMACKLHLH